jgi:RNA polymerase sigma-70 factor (ECF subfamily)
MEGELHGAFNVARRALAFPQRARSAAPVIIDGKIGVLVAPRGVLFGVLTFVIRQGRIVEMEAIADKSRLDLLALQLP